jgi:hypothetical protein
MLLAAGAVLAAVLVANTARPGTAGRVAGTIPARAGRWLPGLLAFALAVASVAHTAGLLSGSGVLRALRLALLQAVLAPETPVAGLALLVALAGVLVDRRGDRLGGVAGGLWRRRPRGPERWLRGIWPALAVAAGAAFLGAAVFPGAMQGWARAEDGDARKYGFYTSFFNTSFNDERVVQREGYEMGKLGLTLPPGRSGQIVFDLERPPDSIVLLRPNFYNVPVDERSVVAGGQPFSNALEVSADGGRSYRTVLADTTVGDVLGGAVYDLTPFLGVSPRYLLRFRATNTTGGEVTVLPSLVVSVVADPATAPDPAFPIVAGAAGVAVLGYAAARVAGRGRGGASVVGLTLATVALVGAALAQDAFPPAGLPGAVAGARPAPATGLASPLAPPSEPGRRAMQGALLVAGAILVGTAARARLARGREGGAGRRIAWVAVGCLLVALVAVEARWEELIRVRYEYLLPDAQGYQAIAAEFPLKMAHYRAERPTPLLDELYASGYDGRASIPAVFYAGGNNGREPLWPATLRLVYDVLGVSAFHTRLTSLGLGVLVAVLTCWLGWRVLHPLAGIAGGLVVALNRPHIVNSVAGLREELVTVLFLCLLAGLFVGVTRGGRAGRWRVAGVGVAAGGLILVRADMLILAGLTLLLGGVAMRWPWRPWLGAAVLAAVLAGPMYVGYAFTHRDPFYPGTYGATVNRNLEFPERMGTPGFPSAEAYAANWAAGPPVSPLRYFFGYHTPLQFVSYSVRGFGRIFTGILFKDQRAVLLLFVAGTGLLLATRRWLVPFGLVVALVPFYAFLAGVPNPWVFAPRYAHHALPLAALAVGYVVWIVCSLPWRLGRAPFPPLDSDKSLVVR